MIIQLSYTCITLWGSSGKLPVALKYAMGLGVDTYAGGVRGAGLFFAPNFFKFSFNLLYLFLSKLNVLPERKVK